MIIPKSVYEWKVSDDFDGSRVDYWFKKQFTNLTYPYICKLIRKGIIRVNGKRTRNHIVLNSGDLIKLSRKLDLVQEPKNSIKYEKFGFIVRSWILHKDENIIVINKPAGIAVQGGTKIKFNVDAVLDSLKFKNELRPKLVHRLDKKTSGVMLIARDLNSAKFLGKIFKERLIEKEYLAIIHGCPRVKLGKIEIPIIFGEKKLESTTYYKILGTQKNTSLAIIKPITGRKHQIRKHLNLIGHPVLGETRFCKKESLNHNESINLFLHAYEISYKDESKKNLKFNAPLPDYFKKKLTEKNIKLNLLDREYDFQDLDEFRLIKPIDV